MALGLGLLLVLPSVMVDLDGGLAASQGRRSPAMPWLAFLLTADRALMSYKWTLLLVELAAHAPRGHMAWTLGLTLGLATNVFSLRTTFLPGLGFYLAEGLNAVQPDSPTTLK